MKKRREKEGNAEEKGTKRKCKGEYSSLRVNIANKRGKEPKRVHEEYSTGRGGKNVIFGGRGLLISYQYADT
jgi:hypothetical protein